MRRMTVARARDYAKYFRHCGFRYLTAMWRRVPDFVVIGAQKCGSTSLYKYITTHPQVVPAWAKEINYFSQNYKRNDWFYRAYFPISRGRYTGEASIGYMAWEGTPARMSRRLPDVKLIAILRDPVHRAYSQYNMLLQIKQTTLSFEEMVEVENRNFAGRKNRLILDTDDYATFYINSCLARGHYADQLEHWLKYYPRGQFLILSTDDLRNDPAHTMDTVFKFLGLPPHVQDHYSHYHKRQYQPMPQAVRDMLVEYYRPHNARLYELAGRDFGWVT